MKMTPSGPMTRTDKIPTNPINQNSSFKLVKQSQCLKPRDS